MVFLFGLAPGGVYPAVPVTGNAVRSYRTISPLPACAGGILSVALAVGSRLPDVIWHPALRSPDFPPAPEGASDYPADSDRIIWNPLRRFQSPRADLETVLAAQFSSRL